MGSLLPPVPPRPPASVCNLQRMGAAFPTRLSFMRILLRRMSAEDWHLECGLLDLDDDGFGTAVYTAYLPERAYSLIAFANPLADEDRTDRVIASAWDAAFALFDGIPSSEDIDRLRSQVPLQEAGRFEATDLVISRANRSLRLFEYVCSCLSRGEQPEACRLNEVGYLMRTTAVYGNGKFGISDRSRIAPRQETRNSFQAEMLAVFLIRQFTFDQLDHIASRRGPGRAVALDPTLKRSLGIGNATGLGMAPFVVSHPELLNHWFAARETAIARVRSMADIAPKEIDRALALLARALQHVSEWQTGDEDYQERNRRLLRDLGLLKTWLEQVDLERCATRLWDVLFRFGEETLGLDAQELLGALLMEIYPEVTKGIDAMFHAQETRNIRMTETVGATLKQLNAQYGWTDRFDFSLASENAHFWYVSENKLEPRFGRRAEEPGADREMPVAIARDMSAFRRTLSESDPQQSLMTFLHQHPEFRHLARRAQALEDHPYGEIQDNLISGNCSPLDILRFKLACFGAAKFDPKSSLWTRITMFQGAPLMDELGESWADDWWLSVAPQSA
ncbi:MAG: hypothetical protein CMH60_04320 [Myxococcales bacterium]|nr:hypothetical protein [Myxococcales bacterium]HCK76753.1 hypothetical protein [Gammaproteobacteria bacterium]